VAKIVTCYIALSPDFAQIGHDSNDDTQNNQFPAFCLLTARQSHLSLHSGHLIERHANMNEKREMNVPAIEMRTG